MAKGPTHPPGIPPQHPSGPPQQPQQQRAPSPWQRYRGAPRPVQIGIGCGALVTLCVLFACISSAFSAGGAGTASSPTATTGQQVVQNAPAATDTPTPKPTATATAVVQPTCIPDAVNCNPWGYNFSPGNLIYQPPAAFCSYFACIPNFWNSTNGYVEQCQDDMFSHSGGVTGSCSHHGGNKRPLYLH